MDLSTAKAVKSFLAEASFSVITLNLMASVSNRKIESTYIYRKYEVFLPASKTPVYKRIFFFSFFLRSLFVRLG